MSTDFPFICWILFLIFFGVHQLKTNWDDMFSYIQSPRNFSILFQKL